LPAANQSAKTYVQGIVTTVNRNQGQLAFAIKVQLEEYARMATLFESRRNELDSRLAMMLGQFHTIDAQVNSTVGVHTVEIERAEKLAQEIDATIAKIADFTAAQTDRRTLTFWNSLRSERDYSLQFVRRESKRMTD
jgi:hypothetical protein